MEWDGEVSYDEIYNHLVERDRTRMREFIETYDLQPYESRLLANDELCNLDHLLSSNVEDIMWPTGGSGHRPLFARGEALVIVGAVLRHYSEVYDDGEQG